MLKSTPAWKKYISAGAGGADKYELCPLQQDHCHHHCHNHHHHQSGTCASLYFRSSLLTFLSPGSVMAQQVSVMGQKLRQANVQVPIHECGGWCWSVPVWSSSPPVPLPPPPTTSSSSRCLPYLIFANFGTPPHYLGQGESSINSVSVFHFCGVFYPKVSRPLDFIFLSPLFIVNGAIFS